MKRLIVLTFIFFGCSNLEVQNSELIYENIYSLLLNTISRVQKNYFINEKIICLGQKGIINKMFIYSFTEKKCYLYDFELKKLTLLKNYHINENQISNTIELIKNNLNLNNYTSGFDDFYICDYIDNKINNQILFYGSELNWGNSDLIIYEKIIKIISQSTTAHSTQTPSTTR